MIIDFNNMHCINAQPKIAYVHGYIQYKNMRVLMTVRYTKTRHAGPLTDYYCFTVYDAAQHQARPDQTPLMGCAAQ